MNILFFIVILGILVFVHELGHFLFAKLFGIRVDEFGFGYPPKMFKMFTWKGTDFTMNWIPFGGFVKIFGESDSGTELSNEDKKVSLVCKPRWQQILVMFGGVLFNIIFAWILFSSIFIYGFSGPVAQAPKDYIFNESSLNIISVLEKSPAQKAGLMAGDIIKEYYIEGKHVLVEAEKSEDIARFISENGRGKNIGFVVLRDGILKNIITSPEKGMVGDNYSIGIALERIGFIKLPFFKALAYGAENTINMGRDIGLGLWKLITRKISMDAVSGPVGIVKQVGVAASFGFHFLIGFTAMLSINLAVLNLIPFPALDGGRIFVLLIESIIRKRLNPNIVNSINMVGFFLLIALMLFVTAKDIINLI